MPEPPHVVIVGAGIAGLTAALALDGYGIRSTVLERSARLGEVGAGIQLSPNASRVLLSLGLGDRLRRTAVEPDALVVRNASGDTVARLPLGDGLRRAYGAPFLVIHRGDLQAALVEAVAARPRISLHTGATVTSAADTESGLAVTVRFADREETFGAEALIGADGVRSFVRTDILGGPGAVYSGRAAWRAVFPADSWTGDPSVLADTGLWLGSRAHVVHYPIRGRSAVNVVVAVDEAWTDQGWDVVGDAAALRVRLDGWPPGARDVVSRPDRWRKWALCAVPGQGPWARGRVALAGDAAHAMLPFVAQGGAMAIEDAAVLARRLSETDRPVAERLAAYVQDRRPRVEAVAEAARRNGRIYHLAGPAAAVRDIGMRVLGPDRLAARMRWIWGWRDL